MGTAEIDKKLSSLSLIKPQCIVKSTHLREINLQQVPTLFKEKRQIQTKLAHTSSLLNMMSKDPCFDQLKYIQLLPVFEFLHLKKNTNENASDLANI